MRRPILPLLTCLLALATGVALISTSLMVAAPYRGTVPLGPPSDAGGADVALVRRFYGAVNTTLATGDPAPLTSLLSTDFADHTLPSGLPPTLDGLTQHVLALSATFPALRLAATEVLAQGEWILVQIRVDGAGDGTFLGVPLAGVPPAWEALDLVRVADGLIAERRDAGGWPVAPLPFTQGLLARPPAAGIVRLARFTYAPGAEQPETPDLGPLLLAVEAGILRAEVVEPAVLTRGAAAATTVPPGTEVSLRPGDGLVIPSGARHRFRNAAPTPTVVLAATLLPWHQAGVPDGGAYLWPVARTPDITAQLLAEGAISGLPSGPIVIRLGRLTLPRHAGLAPDAATGSQLAFVETGTLVAATTGGPLAPISAGTAVLTRFGAAATLRNVGDGPLVILLVTIAPAAAATGSGGAADSGVATSAGSPRPSTP